DLDLVVNPGVWMTELVPERIRPRLHELAGLGYRGVVVVLREPDTMDVNPIAAVLGEAGLRAVTCSNQTRDADISSDDPAVRERGIARLRRAIELTAELGGDQLTGAVYGAWGRADGPVPAGRFERTAKLVGGIA